MIAIALLATVATIAVRVVSLAPALTEDLFAIGAGGAVVGVDAYSDRPSAALRIPRVGSLRTVNSEAIAGLDPDLIVGIPYQAPILRDLARVGVRTQTLPVDTLADDFAAIATLGRLTGHAGEAAALVAKIRRRIDAASACHAFATRAERAGRHRGHADLFGRSRFVYRRPLCDCSHPECCGGRAGGVSRDVGRNHRSRGPRRVDRAARHGTSQPTTVVAFARGA